MLSATITTNALLYVLVYVIWICLFFFQIRTIKRAHRIIDRCHDDMAGKAILISLQDSEISELRKALREMSPHPTAENALKMADKIKARREFLTSKP